MAKQERLHVFIHGRVQGVNFRHTTQQRAKHLKLTGWVRNLPDGRVEIIAEGEREQLNNLLDWVHEGPPMASVSNVEANWHSATGEFTEFSVSFSRA
ncbi:MAG: acylphosphatase [Chloroflexota bacterium]